MPANPSTTEHVFAIIRPLRTMVKCCPYGIVCISHRDTVVLNSSGIFCLGGFLFGEAI